MTKGFQLDRRALLSSVTALGFLASTGRAFAKPAAPTPQQFAKTAKVEQIALSPDAAKLAYVTSEGAERVLIVIDIANGAAQKIPMGAYKLRALFWGSPTHIVFETSVTTPINTSWHVGEYFQTHAFNLETGKAVTLFENVTGYYAVTFGNYNKVRRNGKYYLTASNFQKDPDAISLFEFDLNSTSGKFVDTGREATSDWVIQPDGTLLGRENIDYRRPQHPEYFIEMFIDGKWKDIYRKEFTTEMSSVKGIGPDGKSLVMFINSENAGGYYCLLHADGTLSEPLFDSDATKDPIYHPTTRRLCGYKVVDDTVEYYYDDPVMAGIVNAAKEMVEPGERLRYESFADDPRKVILYTEGPNNAGGYFYADFTTGDIIPILQNYPDIAPEWISDKKAISYKAADGFEIPAYLTLPPFKEAKNLPLIVLVHGGPQSRDTLAFDWEAQTYASQGYAVLQANYRGSGGYDWAFMEAGFGEYGRKMQTDLSDGVRHLAAQGIVDAKRVAIAGASYGGYAALAGATLDRGIYRCAVDVAGVSDPDHHYLNTNLTNNSRYRWNKRMLGEGDLREISPLKNAAKADCPILIIHGQDDTVVSMSESERMFDALRQAGKDVTFIKQKKEDHWQSTEKGRTDMINAIIPFLQKHNPA